MDDVYHRQRLINGWNQDALSEASVAVMGSGWLAGHCALNLVCLGVGRVYLVDQARSAGGERFFFQAERGGYRADSWARWFKWLGYPDRVFARHVDPVYGGELVLPPVEAVVGANTGPAAAEALRRLSTRADTVVAASANGTSGVLTIPAETSVRDDLRAYAESGAGEGPLPAALLGAMAAAEVRRRLLPLPGDCPLPAGGAVQYDMMAPSRVQGELRRSGPVPRPNAGRVMLIGAGALGTFAALGIASTGLASSLVIIDPDYVEATNLNRQPLYAGAVGDGKALSMAKRLREVAPRMRVQHVSAEVSPEHFDLFRPNVVLSCLDNLAARKLVHDECVSRRIPLVNGGTGPLSGHAEVYFQGVTPCLNCLYDLDGMAAAELAEQADPGRCQRAAEPSTVTTNAAVGALMVSEAAHCLSSASWGRPVRCMLRYDASSPARLIAGVARRPCECAVVDREVRAARAHR